MARRLGRRIRKFFSKPLARLAGVTLPYFYYAYMTLVWRTSRVEECGFRRMLAHRIERSSMIAALWHDTVFFVAYAFREIAGSALTSLSDFGNLLTNMLRLCGFEIFRGGSSKAGKSRQNRVLADMIRHMRTHRFVHYGITVDGSRGPVRVLKPGVVAIARATGSPIHALHIASRPRIRLRTWDRSQVPLPFGRIFILVEGPLFCPPDASPDEFRAIVNRAQDLLVETADRAETYLDTGVLTPRLLPVDPWDGPPAEIVRAQSLLSPGLYAPPVPRTDAPRPLRSRVP